MNKPVGIHSRISKVNHELAKLASIIKSDQEAYSKTREFLLELQDECDSDDSLTGYEAGRQLGQSKRFGNKIEVISNF